MLTAAKLSIAVEQVEISAKESGLTPLEVVRPLKKGNPTQQQIYQAVLDKHPEEKKDA